MVANLTMYNQVIVKSVDFGGFPILVGESGRGGKDVPFSDILADLYSTACKKGVSSKKCPVCPSPSPSASFSIEPSDDCSGYVRKIPQKS